MSRKVAKGYAPPCMPELPIVFKGIELGEEGAHGSSEFLPI
jgi:hypothetical protein